MVYYTVEVNYKSGPDARLFRITNLKATELQQLREKMFVAGIYRKIDDTTGEVISPWLIIQTMIYKQDYYFNAETTTLVQSAKEISSPIK